MSNILLMGEALRAFGIELTAQAIAPDTQDRQTWRKGEKREFLLDEARFAIAQRWSEASVPRAFFGCGRRIDDIGRERPAPSGRSGCGHGSRKAAAYCP